MEHYIVRDDHYIPDPMNAHVNTRAFIEGVRKRIAESAGLPLRDTTADFHAARRSDIFQTIYDYTHSLASDDIEEPENDDLVCRYLSPEKFLWFLGQKSISFARPSFFDDDFDCALHADWNDAILVNLRSLVTQNSGDIPRSRAEEATFIQTINAEWESFERTRRQDWLISCWTKLSNHHDDKLIWYKYAGGPFGVGITARYGELRSLIRDQIESLDRDENVRSGLVSYDPRVIKALPFNKRPGFSGEREVRFALRTPGKYISVDVKEDFADLFRLRLSDDAPPHHHGVVRNLWVQAGGHVDAIHTS